MHGERAGFWNAALRHRRFQIDIERRDGLAGLTPAQRTRHREMIASEPEPLCHALLRRQRARAFGKTDVAGEVHRITGDQPAHGAILLVAVLHRVLHEAGINHDGVAVGQLHRHERPDAGPGHVVANRGAGRIDHGIRQRRVGRCKTDAAEFVFGRRQRIPLRARWQRLGRCCEPLVQQGDQRMLLDPALQLPDPQAREGQHHRQREDGETGHRRPPRQEARHFGSRSISRPGAAL
jgi:hypothetical protein